MARWFRILAPVSMIVFATLGCGDSGPELGTVTGVVTMDAKPLPNAVVTFAPAEGGRAAIGTTDANGNYRLIFLDRDGALVGKHKVSVTSQPKAVAVKEMKSDDPEYQKQAFGTGSEVGAAANVEMIPPRYNSRTELVKDVTAGKNEINLELTSK